MLNQYVAPAQAIARGLGIAEANAKDTLRSTASLIITTIDARDEVGGSLDLGRVALLHLADAAAHAAKAYDATLIAHAAFASDRDRVGLTPRIAGCGTGSMDEPSTMAMAAVAA